MFSKFVKDYFSFSKKERVAVLILIFLIFVIFSLPYFLPAKSEEFNDADFEKFRQEASRLWVDKGAPRDAKHESDPGSPTRRAASGRYRDTDEGEDDSKPELFYFDPNTLASGGWKKLGIPERNIRTIHNYLSKGGKFRNPEDIGKIYGLRPADVARLKPFIRIRSVAPEYPDRKGEQRGRNEHTRNLPLVKAPPSLIDLNTADTTSLISLPGIGSKLATRIIRFRDKLGGFYTTQQLAEVYGLPDSTFQQLQNRVSVNGSMLKKINVNTATLQDLQDHPYLRGTTARLLFEYRSQHGIFDSLEDLLQIETINPELFERLNHYLTVTEKP